MPPGTLRRHAESRVGTIWKRLSRKSQALSVILIVCAGSYIFYWTFRVLVGWYFLIAHYLRTALGSRLVQEPCYRVKLEARPFRSLSNKDWFLLQRCRGIEWGFERQGQVIPTITEVAMYAAGLRSSVILIIWSIFFFMYKIMPWLLKMAMRNMIALLSNDNTSGLAQTCVLTFLFGTFLLHHYSPLLALMSILLLLLTASLILRDDYVNRRNILNRAIAGARNIAVLNPFFALFDYVQDVFAVVWRRWPLPPVRFWGTFIHRPARCDLIASRDRLVAENLGLKHDIDELRAWLAQAELNHKTATESSQHYINYYNYCKRVHTEEHQQGSLSKSPSISTVEKAEQAELEEARRINFDLRAQIIELSNQRSKETAAFITQIDSLQAQAKWAQGALDATMQAKRDFEQADALNKRLSNELGKISEQAIHLQQALAKEKEHHSEKCQDSAGCQIQISDLRNKLNRVLDKHMNYEIMARDAAVALGYISDAAQHCTLEEYVETVTFCVIRSRAMNEPGYDMNAMESLFKSYRHSAEQAYRERLENEVSRLGGSISAVRIGLDTSRPRKYKVKALSYEENLHRVFPFYQNIAGLVLNLSSKFNKHGVLLPAWPREKKIYLHDNTRYLGLSTTNSALVNRADPRNSPNSEHLEAVTEKLVRAEIQRWYNRGLFLVKFVKHKNVFPLLDDASQLDISNLVEETEKSLSIVLRQVLDDIRPLSQTLQAQPPRQRLLKKFEIYMCMKAAVYGLTQTILNDQREPPSWDLEDQALDIVVGKRPPELDLALENTHQLQTALLNGEILTLRYRTFQLGKQLEQTMVSGGGSEMGFMFPGHVLNLPMLEERWRTTLAITFWADLARRHWDWHSTQVKKQIADPEKEGAFISVFDPPNHNLVSLDINLFSRSVGLWQVFKTRGWNPLGWNALDISGNEKKSWMHSPEQWEQWKKLDFTEAFAPWREWRYRLPDNAVQGDIQNWGFLHLWKDQQEERTTDLKKQTEDQKKRELREALRVMQIRVRQLDNYVTYYGIRYNMPPYPCDISKTRKNASEESTKLHMNECQGWVAVLTTRLNNHGKFVPNPVANGGVFDPANPKRRH